MSHSRSPLEVLIRPSSIVICGASPERYSLGGILTENLTNGGYQGAVHLVNPKYRQIGEHSCYAALADVGKRVDLALIASPAAAVGEILEQCGASGVRAAVVYSAGFSETGAEGLQREAELKAVALRQRIRLFGPRAVGFVRPSQGVNAIPLRRTVPAGKLALVSQSGTVCAGILDWVFAEDVALSAVFAPGNGCDLDLPEILDFLAGDPETRSILLYLEGVRDRRRFMSALRAAARVKPVVVVKSGRHTLSARVAEAHNRVAVGDDAVFDAALRRAGALRVNSISELFSAARALISPRMPRATRLAIVANGGGPCVVAADVAAERGIHLARLGDDSVATLVEQLPASWSISNPVDLLFDADPRRFRLAIEVCLADEAVDGTLVLVSPSSFFDPLEVARVIAELGLAASKPLLACVIGEGSVRAARQLLSAAGIPTFRTPESAVLAFSFMAHFVRHQELLLETPPAQSSSRAADVATARSIVDQTLAEGRSALEPEEAAGVLTAFRIPTIGSSRAAAGGLRAVRVVLRNDPGFGPVIFVGEGGMAADVGGGAAVALPPLSHRLIIDLLRQPAVLRLFEACRAGPAISPPILSRILQRVSEIACELPCIDVLEIDPLAGDGHELFAAGVSITVSPKATNWRYGHMAICPYPLALEVGFTARSGVPCSMRPIRPEDATAFQRFVRGLSTQSRYSRFFGSVNELTQRQLATRTQIDYDRDMMLIAVVRNADGEDEIVAEADYSVLADELTGELGVAVADAYVGQGIGSRLTRQLLEAARRRGLQRIVGQVLSDNESMLGLLDALGFTVGMTDDPEVLDLSLRL